MRILSSISAGLMVLALATSGSPATGGARPAASERIYSFHYENVLGTSLELKVGASSLTQAQKAETAALREIYRESKILSSWDQESEFSRWTATHGQPVRVSDHLFRVLAMYDEWRMRTNGALSASAETVIRVWKAAAK